jgi:hypothetical protein
MDPVACVENKYELYLLNITDYFNNGEKKEYRFMKKINKIDIGFEYVKKKGLFNTWYYLNLYAQKYDTYEYHLNLINTIILKRRFSSIKELVEFSNNFDNFYTIKLTKSILYTSWCNLDYRINEYNILLKDDDF